MPVIVQARVDARRASRQDTRESQISATARNLPSYQTYDNDTFMALPPEEEMRDRLQMFIDATGNDAMRKVGCMSCGGRFFASLCRPKPLALDDIPHVHNLKPEVEHPAHVYKSGLLLEPTALSVSLEGAVQGTICVKCYNSLASNTRPTNSLARGFWLGDVPDAIKQLTFAERILIQLAFPRAYLVKLQPKRRSNSGAQCSIPHDQLFDGLSGSVCSVKMPADDVIQMLEGKLVNTPTLPSPPIVLAHTISIAYLGFGKAPPYYLRNLFVVRRKVVLAAIKWLQLNNPVYKNVTIDEDALDALPDDGVPDSIIIRDGASAQDIAFAASEGTGYTRQDEQDTNEDAEQDAETNESADDHESHEPSLGLAGDAREHDSSTADR